MQCCRVTNISSDPNLAGGFVYRSIIVSILCCKERCFISQMMEF